MRRPNAAISLLAPVLAGLAMIAALPAQAAGPSFAPPALFDLGHPKPAPSLVFAYHGFQVDVSRARHVQSPDKTIRAVQAQIDLVEHMGLKPEVLAFMRTAPILADTSKVGESGHYVRGQGVLLKVKKLAAKKPVLLVGLLEAYHVERLANAPVNSDIARFRAQAQTGHVWPVTALMLQSDTEFFAQTSCAYLYGAITHEPYSRVNLRQTQPQYAAWLAKFFDDGKPRG